MTNAGRYAPALATPEQIAAEAILRSLMADGDLQALLDSEYRRLESTEIAATSDGKARMRHAIKTWTGGFILRWLSGDPYRPSILLSTDNTPRHWCGYEVPATGAAGDNPDHIYRNSFIDGAGEYEIRGRIDVERRPIQFSIEVSRGEPGKIRLSTAASATSVKNQIDILTDGDLKLDPDGRFTVTLSPVPSTEPNSLTMEPEPMALTIRDVLSDWEQAPTWLELRRIDLPSERASHYEDVKARVIADLPDYLDFWATFPLGWMGGIEPNGYKPPVPRDGGWGYQAGVRYSLAPDDALLVTMKRGRAAYLGIQVGDPWFLAPNGHEHTSSLNTSQAQDNDDGTYTYVVAAEDPEVANWIDTGGSHEGLCVLRWQAVPAGEPVEDYLLEVRKLTLAELKHDFPELPRLTPDERAEQRRSHAEQYRRRFS